MNDLGQGLIYHSATREDNYAIFTTTRNVLNLRLEGCEVLLGRMWGNFDANDDKGDSLILNIKSIWRYLN